MTLPTLVQNYQKNVLKNQFKKVYSNLSNALQRTYVDNGEVYYECYYAVNSDNQVVDYGPTSECRNFFKAFKQTLNVVKVCEDNALANGCIAKDMKGVDDLKKSENPDITDEELQSYMSNRPAYSAERIKNTNEAWVLSDGTVVGLYGTTVGNYIAKLFWVDINGHKKPNKWGYDIFSFDIDKNIDNNNVYLGPITGYYLDKGGITTQGMINSLYK